MKKIYLITLVILSFLSCESKKTSVVNIKEDTMMIVKEETLDERIQKSDSILSTNGVTWAEESCKNTREILRNQIVIMKKLKELHK